MRPPPPAAAAGGRRIRALNVAEKNSVAREMCRVLGGGVIPNGNPPVGEFPYRLLGNVDVVKFGLGGRDMSEVAHVHILEFHREVV